MMLPPRFHLHGLTALLLLLPSANGSDLLPPTADIPAVIDHYVDAKLQSYGTAAVAPTSDDILLRRTTLDLAGRIPTAAERTWYLQQPVEQRRALLVDRLLQLPDSAFHQRNELDALLLYNRPHDREFRNYLLWAAREDRRWDQIFRDLLLAQEAEGPLQGATQFLKSRIRQVDDVTNDTAVLFFGVNISCAKCHDHPLVADWKQDHFYGMQSFFSRTYQTKKNTIAEKLFDEVKFTTTAGESRVASYLFLTGSMAEDGTPEYTDEERKAIEEKVRNAERKDDSEIPVPDFSPRRQLVELALNDTTDLFFAGNIVNRIWARLTGTGLVTPLDQMHSENPPSHPELLDWLSRDLQQHGYDLKRLIRGIVLSDVYARSSEWTSDDEPPSAQLFAVARTRPLTPYQLAVSLQVASRNPDQWPAIDTDGDWAKVREDLENQAGGWVREFEQPGDNFQVAVDEALFFSNNARIQDDLLRDTGDRIVGCLKTIDNDDQQIETLWQTVVCRSPTPEERQAALDWLTRSDNRTSAVQQLTWALMSGPEFRFNH
ncbi:MAG: DUF1553 domain-containing protein [Fuerstiella sp.]